VRRGGVIRANRRLGREIDLPLGNSTRRGAPRSGTRQPNLLADMLFDGDGKRMTPTHAVKNGPRYRYYVSRPLITKDRTEHPAALRIPAGEIEQW
jgi:site-specific DNA recombinase